MNKGWECPKCGRVWAPCVERCDCITLQNGTTLVPSRFGEMPAYPPWPSPSGTSISDPFTIPEQFTACDAGSPSGKVPGSYLGNREFDSHPRNRLEWGG